MAQRKYIYRTIKRINDNITKDLRTTANRTKSIGNLHALYVYWFVWESLAIGAAFEEENETSLVFERIGNELVSTHILWLNCLCLSFSLSSFLIHLRKKIRHTMRAMCVWLERCARAHTIIYTQLQLPIDIGTKTIDASQFHQTQFSF